MKNQVLLVVAVCLLSSCGSHKYFPEVNQHSLNTIEISNDQKNSLFINSIKLESGENIDATFQNYLINTLKSTNAFDEVIMYGSKQNLKNYISVDIMCAEEIDLHPKSNYRKAYFIGATLFGIVSFTNFKYDYELNIVYDFNKEGTALNVTTESSRSLSKKYFSKEKPDNLVETVRDDLEAQLIRQIQSNKNFFKR